MMEKTFCLGFMLGAVGGALLVANSHKARVLVKKGQDELKQKISEMIDDKFEELTAKTKAQESTNSSAKKMPEKSK